MKYGVYENNFVVKKQHLTTKNNERPGSANLRFDYNLLEFDYKLIFAFAELC